MSTFDGENPDDMSRVMVRAAYAEHCEFRVPPGPTEVEHAYLVALDSARRSAHATNEAMTTARHLALDWWGAAGDSVVMTSKTVITQGRADEISSVADANLHALVLPTTGAGWIHTDCCEPEPAGAEGLG